MTRDQIRTAIDRVLGVSSPERMLRELHSSIMRKREQDANRTPMHNGFRAADFNVIGIVFRQLRTAAEKSSSRR